MMCFVFYLKFLFIFSALSAAKSAMPHSPHKRHHVMKVVASTFQHALSPSSESTSSRGKKQLQSGLSEIVQQFYCRDDVSRPAPGMRDFIIVREGGVKQKLQKVKLQLIHPPICVYLDVVFIFYLFSDICILLFLRPMKYLNVRISILILVSRNSQSCVLLMF
jgi:hypothetical protein